MYDKELVHNILNQCLKATETILFRFENIKSPDDFTNSPVGMEKLDSICMLLIAIGENIKKIDSLTQKKLLTNFPNTDWKGIMGLRDIISHHYFDIDAEEIFWVCDNEIPKFICELKNIKLNLEI